MKSALYFYCLRSSCNRVYSGRVTLSVSAKGLTECEFDEVVDQLKINAEIKTRVKSDNWALTTFNKV